jgi:two-component system, chemotaxis family, sensor kinase CheA
MIPLDLRELVEGFVSESLDNLDDNEIKIGKLSYAYNAENVESIFRVFHTLKGLSGFFELSVIQKVTHSAETLFDLFRTQKTPVNNNTVDLLYAVFDFLQKSLKSTRQNYTDELLREESLVLLEQLDKIVEELNNPDTNKDTENDGTNNNSNVELFYDEIEDNDDFRNYYNDFVETVNFYITDFSEIINQLSQSYSDVIVDQMEKVFNQFKAPSSLLELKAINKTIISAETLLNHYKYKKISLAESSAIVFEKIKNLIIKIINHIDINNKDDEFVYEAETLSKQVQEEVNALNAEKSRKVNKTEPLLIDIIDTIDESFVKIQNDENDIDSIASLLENLTKLTTNKKLLSNLEIKDVLHSIHSIIQSVANKEINAGAIITIIKSDFKILGKFIRENEVNKIEHNTNNAIENNSSDNSQAIIDKNKIKDVIKVETEKNTISERKEVRVSTDKLNKLFDLVGEIITAESIVVNNKNLVGLKLPDFKAASNMLNKLIRELQKITMSIRMVPLEGLFNKMSRVVRDLSRKVNKPVELEIYGSETEMDKNVIEQLSDPLVHMLRNCLDHGIENEAIRLAKGKPIVGKIILGASYQGNEIHISVEDDGAGLNREKIISKAISNGQLNADPTELTNKEVWNLIFLPGLTTTELVSDVSGRGVGMDVVKKNLETLRGGIEIDSKYGSGTKIKFRIPLTLAIMDTMIVRVGSTKYAIPILSVRESFQPKQKDITRTMDGIDVVKVRNEMFPIVRLHELMNKVPDNYDLLKGILMMLDSHTKKVCLFVDEIIGQQQAVVKPLSSYIGDIQGLTGCMVMPDGKIGLIIDVDGLIEKAENLK